MNAADSAVRSQPASTRTAVGTTVSTDGCLLLARGHHLNEGRRSAVLGMLCRHQRLHGLLVQDDEQAAQAAAVAISRGPPRPQGHDGAQR
jgi:hypothetical protein